MKKDIHPKYNTNTKVTCSCGNVFYTGSVKDEIVTELCSQCHPFYTGELKIVDAENMVAKFESKKKKAESMGSFKSKKEKMEARKAKIGFESTGSSVSLKDMLAQLSK